MFCTKCGFEAKPGQKFCPECGSSLAGITDETELLPAVDAPEEIAIASTPEVPSSFREESGADLDEALRAAGVSNLDNVDDLPALDELPDVSALPTREIRVRPPIPEPSWATPTPDPVPDLAPDAGIDELAAPAADATVVRPASPEDASTTVLPSTDGVDATRPRAGDSGWVASGSDTSVMDAAPAEWAGHTDPYPAVFDGSSELAEFPEPREPFRLKLVFVLAFFGAIGVLLTAIADVIDIRTSVPVDGIATGVRTLDTLGTNLAVAAFFGATVMTLGALLACFGFRWGAGLAGGAGLALVGWAALVAGLAELRIASAESITRQTTEVAFTLRITRDLGFWLVVAVAVIGLLVFFASLGSFGTGGRPALNPWIAAIGAVAGVVLVAGPLLPEGNATFSNNFRSATTVLDLPTVYFGGRLAQLALIGATVVVGLLIVRSYGLGLAAGGVSVAAWMWLSSLLEVGSFPLGIAAGNFGASDSSPHAVTTVGMALTLVMLLIAAVLATVGSARQRSATRR